MSLSFEQQTPVSQLLKRNLKLFENKKLIIAGALEDNFAQQLAQLSDHCQLFCTDYRLYRYYQQHKSIQASFAAQFQGDKAELLLLYMPKSKDEAKYLLASICPFLNSDAQILLVGENRGGINSAPKLLSPYSSTSMKVDSARRCSLFSAFIDQSVPSFIFQDWFKHFEITVNNTELTICSLPGVFSHGRLDEATHLLLKHIAQQNKRFTGRLLDFGCGAGVIASYLAKTNDSLEAELVDINAFALASSKATLKANHISAKVYASDVYSDIQGQFEHIISNPPFHAGLNTHYSSTETFLENSNHYLKDKGELTIVANSFLKYQAFIDKALAQCEVLSPSNKFKIYCANN